MTKIDIRHQFGLSLIELMVALTIGLLLTLGMIQIFGATRATYQMQEGLSRVQESGRYATQYLQSQLRMVGYMGCGADTERAAQGSLVNHLGAHPTPSGTVDPLYRFQRPLEAFSADDLPAYLTALNLGAIAGTEVLVLRVPGGENVPVLEARQIPPARLELNVNLGGTAAQIQQQLPEVDGQNVLYMMETCRSSHIFAGTYASSSSPPTLTVQGLTAPNVYADPSVDACGLGTGCPWDYRISSAFLNAPAGGRTAGGATAMYQLNAVLHRAELSILYVANNPNGVPSLYLRRLERGGNTLAAAEELAEGVENLMFQFGVDTDGDIQVNEYESAAAVVAGAVDAVAIDAAWRRVVSVRMGMLLRSPEHAGVSATIGEDERTYTVLGKTITPSTTGVMRQVYETTVALRNRIYNS